MEHRTEDTLVINREIADILGIAKSVRLLGQTEKFMHWLAVSQHAFAEEFISYLNHMSLSSADAANANMPVRFSMVVCCLPWR